MKKIVGALLSLVLTFAPALAQNGLPGGPGQQIPNSTGGGGGGSPTGAAGGDLSGTYPNPTVAKINGATPAASATTDTTNATNITTGTLAPARVGVVAAGTAGPLSAVDASTTNARAPTGTAGGGLTGTYPNPTVAAVPTTALTGTLQAAQEPAHTGDVTNTAGSLALSVIKIGGVAPAASATTDTTNATNITTGTLANGRYAAVNLAAGSVNGGVAGVLPGTNQAATNLAASGNGGVTGTLPVANGGTGVAVAPARINVLTNNTPTGTSSTAAPVMMGLGSATPGPAATITPTTSGKLLIVVSGNIGSTGAAGNGAQVQVRVGTGTAPANGAAATGSAAGYAVNSTTGAAGQTMIFSASGYLSGFAVGTPVWIDVALQALIGGTANVTSVTITVIEE